MRLTPKTSFKWTVCCCCCGPLTPALLTLLAETCHHLVLLTLSSLLLASTESFLQSVTETIDTNDRLLERSQFYQNIKENILTSPTLYTSIPVILNVVFLMCNMFTVVGVLISSQLLIFPWLILSCIKIVFITSTLLYLVIIQPIAWFQVILCLVIVPVIVIESSLWTIIFKLYRRLRSVNRKKRPTPKVEHISQSQSVTDDISTTVAMEELAVSPPHITWNADYLLEHDPRYLQTEDEDDDMEDDELEDELEDEESDVDWESEESYYQSDDYTVRAPGEETEIFTETDGELLEDLRNEETDFPDDESEHYKTPGIPRPVMRLGDITCTSDYLIV